MVVTRNAITTQDHEVLGALGAELERQGLAAFLAAFPPNAPGIDQWPVGDGRLGKRLRALVDLFVLRRPTAVCRLPEAVAATLPLLAERGVAERTDDGFRLTTVALLRPAGTWLFAEPPGPFLSRHYFDTDSLALAGHASYRHGATCLDLCAGPGFQGLVAATRCRQVTMVELASASARLAEVNVALNRMTDRILVHCGDLYAPIPPGERYDHVVANVPFIPVPAERGFDPAMAGGQDGFAIGRRVLAGLGAHLAPGGTAHLSALLLRAGEDLLLYRELAEWATSTGCAVSVTLTGNSPIDLDSDLVQHTASDVLEVDSSADPEQVATEVAELYTAQGATSACLAFLRVDRPGTGVHVIDLAQNRCATPQPWLPAIPDALTVGDPATSGG